MSLTKEMVRKKMRERNVVLLNVLPEGDYVKFHIQGSYNQPLLQNRDEFARQVETRFGKDVFFITYSAGIICAAGPNAAKALRIRGLMADDYPGGVQEWFESGLPTEGLHLHPTAPLR